MAMASPGVILEPVASCHALISTHPIDVITSPVNFASPISDKAYTK